jgi:hypothetical protein
MTLELMQTDDKKKWFWMMDDRLHEHNVVLQSKEYKKKTTAVKKLVHNHIKWSKIMYYAEVDIDD